VISDIPAGETWGGYPARPHREALRAHAALMKLTGMMRRLERLLDREEQ
jgi:UDP-3-O-[3-hydroxymyristoyl] glucosamine N-acyltransferase